MYFYLATHDYDDDSDEPISPEYYATREEATEGLRLWLDEYGGRNPERYYVKCQLDGVDRDELRKVPDPFTMMRNLQEAGPEAVHRAAKVGGFTALLNVMGATNECGTRLIDNELLWELSMMGGSSGESAIIRCALCVSAPYYEFWGVHFLPSYKKLDDGLKACVRAAMQHI